MVIEATDDGFSIFKFDTDFYSSEFYKSKKIVGIKITEVKIFNHNESGTSLHITSKNMTGELISKYIKIGKTIEAIGYWYWTDCNVEIKSLLPWISITAKSTSKDVEKITIDYDFIFQQNQPIP